MWRAIPSLKWLGMAARNPFALKILERIYLLFLRARPSLQTALTRWDGLGAAR
jgi:hypothetical protein